MLALVGSGEYLPPMEAVDRFLLDSLPQIGRVVCLPTAAGAEGDERVAYWSALGVEHFSRLGAQAEALPVIDRHSANDAALASRIRQANFVYLSGGSPGYLLKTLKDSLAWEAILEVLEFGGILAGCSAGAMVMGERIPGFPAWKPAFNLLPGAVIVPHFDELSPNFVRLIRLWAGRRPTLFGIEGNTALVVNGNRLQVVGSGKVVVWGREGLSTWVDGMGN